MDDERIPAIRHEPTDIHNTAFPFAYTEVVGNRLTCRAWEFGKVLAVAHINIDHCMVSDLLNAVAQVQEAVRKELHALGYKGIIFSDGVVERWDEEDHGGARRS